jgi:basic membrane protein A and related proteins
MKKIVALLLAVVMAASATACASSTPAASSAAAASSAPAAVESKAEVSSTAAKADFKVGMVTDTGGVNDQSFNQSAWEGLQQFSKDTGASVKYSESKQETDYATNLDKAADDGNNLIWGIGFAMADALTNAAKSNPDISYAIIDNSYGDKTPSNVTGVVFRAQEPSFLVGYIAAKTTKTGKVGFVGGMTSSVIDQFEYGYKAGVAYGAKELGKTITVDAQYAESFTDSAKGKAIAQKMYSNGCDIVFHAAGGVGVGVIEAAKEANKFAIGVDRDQAYLAPSNVLTSAMKLVNQAIALVSKDAMDGKEIGGKTYDYGLTENAVGIPTEHKLMGDATYTAAMALVDKIKDKTITPPANKDEFAKYQAALK